jgi:putative ABC transport system ATP-binding protein
MEDNMELIEAHNLTKTYQEIKKGTKDNIVLNDVSLKIKKGEFVIITGPSGSGKTTLLNLLSGLDTPTSGDVFFKHKRLKDFTKKEKILFRQVSTGFVFQSYELLPTLSVFDNVSLPVIIKGEKVDPNVITSLLKLVGIEHLAQSYPDQLSGGEKQRVAIARSIVNFPSVLFADEPTGNLDKQKADEIIQLFDKINKEKNTTIILVTHNLSHLCYASRVIELSNAKIIKDESRYG